MGTIIGRQGLKIKQIQDASGVRMVAQKEMLPQSTERIVEVQGTPEGIQKATWEIGKCLVDDWQRGTGTVLYNPVVRAEAGRGGPLSNAGGVGASPLSPATAHITGLVMELTSVTMLEGPIIAARIPMPQIVDLQLQQRTVKRFRLRTSVFHLTWLAVLLDAAVARSAKSERVPVLVSQSQRHHMTRPGSACSP